MAFVAGVLLLTSRVTSLYRISIRLLSLAALDEAGRAGGTQDHCQERAWLTAVLLAGGNEDHAAVTPRCLASVRLQLPITDR